MLPLVTNGTVPVEIEKPLERLRFHRIVLDLFEAFLVGLVALLEGLLGILGKYGRHKGDMLAIARPNAGAGVGADRRELPRLAAGQVDDPQLSFAATVR